MKKWQHKVEVFVDRSIPYCLILLFVFIVLEIGFHGMLAPYHTLISIADGIIISFFVVDLIFKYLHVRDIPIFLRKYWIDIIAVFPAFLVVRVIEEAVLIANLDETILLSQEALEVGERTGSKASRVHYFGRFIKPLARIPRFFKAFHFYERPHHWF